MVDGYGPTQVVQRPGIGRDPGVNAKASTSLATKIDNPIGNSLLGFAQEIDKTAATFRSLTVERQGSEDKTFVDTFQLELNKRYATVESEMLNSPDTKKPEFVNMFDKRLADTQKEVMDELIGSGQYNPSKEGRDAAIASAMSARTGAARRAAVTAHNQNVLGNVDAVSENVIAIARVAGLYGNLDDGMERVERSVSSLRNVLTPDKYEAARKAAREQVFTSVVQGYIDTGNFPQARMLLDRNRGFAANTTERVIADAATKSGIPPSYLVALARIESSGNNNAKPKADPVTGLKTSAAGIFGFIESTGAQYGLPADASKATIEQQAKAAAEFTKSNQSELRKALGREPTPAELYLGHFLGSGDAIKVLNAPATQPVEGLVKQKSVGSNTSILAGKTAGEVVGWANAKMMRGGAGGSGFEIDEQKRITLLNAIEVKQNQLETTARTERARVMKETGDGLLREAYNQSVNGTLEPRFIEIIRPFVSPAEYHGLLKIVTKGAEADGQDAIVDLTNSIDTMDPESFVKKANQYVEQHKLTTQSYVTMIQRNKTAYKDDKPASPYKRGREFINDYLDVGQLTGASTVPIANMARARARQEFDSWVEANPKAQSHEIIEEANSIARRSAIVQFDQMRQANPLSKYFNSKTRASVTIDEVDKAEEQLVLDKEAGRMTPGQVSVESSLLKNWREILEAEAARKSEPAKSTPKR